jgi:distribution and morphology protein 31
VSGKRANSSNTKGNGDNNKSSAPRQEPEAPQQAPAKTPSPEESEHASLADSMSKYLHLPKMPHRPTKEELLAAASGFGQRLKVRFKWFSIRSMRPWNADEWGAFVSWFVFGHIVWILVGTTTFFSLIILFINTVFAQGRQAPMLGGYWEHANRT